MKNNKILLSLCIPTDGKVELAIPTIESIYSQNIDPEIFEVIVTDNGKGDELSNAIKKFKYENFHYYKTTSIGFTNQIDAFEKCNGIFCKMVNHRLQMLPGSINELISIIEKYKETKPIIYCSDGNINAKEITECRNIDEFANAMKHWMSWSGGTCVWQEDIPKIRKCEINQMFPHLVFLLGLRENSQYVVWNKAIDRNIDDKKKGGYNYFHTFAVDFLDIVHTLRILNKITPETFLIIKRSLFYHLSETYLKEVIRPARHKYDMSGCKNSMSIHYGELYYYYMIIYVCSTIPYRALRSTLRHIKNVFKKSKL